MSYTFLQEQGEESSVASFSDIPACVLSRLNLTAGKSCCNGSGTESCHDSPSGMMSGHSMESRGEEGLMLCAEGSHARTSLLEVPRRQDCLEREAGFISKCGVWLAKLCPDTFLWKTPQPFLFEELEQSLETWPRWGTIVGGACFPLEMLAHDTSVRGCLSFPTVTASWAGRGPGLSNNMDKMRMSEKCTLNTLATITEFGWRWPAVLCEKMMMWPVRWTALAPLETARFRRWLNSHGKH